MIDRIKATLARGSSNQIGLAAAGISYYAFVALVPLLAASVLIYGLVVTPEMLVDHLTGLTQTLPQSAAELIGEQLRGVVEGSGGAKGLGLLVALAIALFGARNAAAAIVMGLNEAYDVDETRGFLKLFGLALAITIGAIAVLALVGFAIGLAGSAGGGIGTVLTYALLLGVAVGGAAALYRIAPAMERRPWGTVLPGALLFAALWLLATVGFGFYAARFGNYNATYGSLAAVIILLTWLYISAYSLLFGAEYNAVAREG